MHPIIRSGRLGVYLLAWVPVEGALTVLFVKQSGLGVPASIGAAFPLCVLHAVVCLSAWYPCRALPLWGKQFTRSLTTHLTSAVVAGGIWTGAAKLLFSVFSRGDSVNSALPVIFGMGVVLYLLTVALYYVFLAVEASQEAQAREAEARLLAGEAELRALKAQINPHFLFNSLHSISALTSQDAARAREMCILLSGFLRKTLGLSEKAAIPLEEELALARSYLAIEKIRFGARLQVEENIDPGCADFPVPALVLQPLVENAVIHGIASLVDPGFIRISGAMQDADRIAIVVENSFDTDSPPARRGGFGLVAVRKRLDARYGGRASIQAAARDDVYRVELRLPIDEEFKP
ncbi:MAG: sensor histidine kinase [Terriglobia bacterium]|nr:MAG: sensor histidine kinase [Terriglobia bacterium]